MKKPKIPAEVMELWHKFQEHYGAEYRFGINDRGGLVWSFSVMDKRTNRAKIDTMEMGLPAAQYKAKWWELMKGFENDPQAQGR